MSAPSRNARCRNGVMSRTDGRDGAASSVASARRGMAVASPAPDAAARATSGARDGAVKVGCVASGGRGGGSNTGTASGALSASSSTGSTEGMRSRNGCSAAWSAGALGDRLARSRRFSRRMLRSRRIASTGRASGSSAGRFGSAACMLGRGACTVRRLARPTVRRRQRVCCSGRGASARVSAMVVRPVLPLPIWAQCSAARRVLAHLQRTVRSLLARLAVRRQAAPRCA